MTMEVFVYGTLTDRERTASVLDSFAYRGRAVLSGLHRVDGNYPTLAPGGEVTGRLLVTEEVAALDAYERVDRDLYVRVSVPTADGDDTVETYVGDPDRLDAPVDWPADGDFADRVRTYVRDHDVTVSTDP
jgi:gamma-glutamylaminecyclotransferase